MSPAAIIGVSIVVLVVLAAVVFVTSARRNDARGALSRETKVRDRKARKGERSEAAPVPVTGREVELAAATVRRGGELVPASSAPPAVWTPPDPDAIGVSRRQFFNRSMVAMMGLALSGFGGAVLAFLWPRLSGGFGSKITIGKLDDINQSIKNSRGFFYVPEGRAWITAYPKEALPKAEKAYGSQGPVLEGMKSGIVALYQKCPHLGCRVPQCESSQWFECPCHGSQYNRVGEKKGGPAPRGMDRFAVSINGGVVSIDTGSIFQGPPIGTNTTGQEAEGPHCIGNVGGHG